MKNIFYALSLIVCFTLSAIAQEEQTPKAELFGGYSYAGENSHGWNASVAGNVNEWFGVVADFNGQYTNTREPGIEEKIRTTSYLFGPQFSLRKNKRVTPFARALFGGSNIKTRAVESGQAFSFNDNSFTMAVGGGLDVNLNDRVAIRAFQIDYVRTHFFDQTQNKGRLSFGIVFRLGKK